MYKQLTTSQVVEALWSESSSWSYAGATALAGYLEEIEEGAGEEMELDVVAIRCDWAEYSTAVAAIRDYCGPDELDEDELDEDELDEDEKEAAARDYLRERTAVIEIPAGGVIVQAF